MTNTLAQQIKELDDRLKKGETWLNDNLQHPKHEEYFDKFIELLNMRNDLENEKLKQGKLF